MNIQELSQLYAHMPQLAALAKVMGDKKSRNIFLDGLLASSSAMLFGSLTTKCKTKIMFVMQDADEAGYLYHDLTQILGDKQVLFFPSSYRRAVKYGQKDSANEILRTETLCEIKNEEDNKKKDSSLFIVSYPEAMAELVVSHNSMDSRMLTLAKGDEKPMNDIVSTLRDFGFSEVDYVYEPGQFARRGSILDVFSFSSEYPFRIDFFGDEIDTIRTFEVENQLSKDKCDNATIVPELSQSTEERIPILQFLPKDTFLCMKDFTYVCDIINKVYEEGFSQQALVEMTAGATEMECQEIMNRMRSDIQLVTASTFMRDALDFRMIEMGHKPSRNADTTIRFDIKPQPLFHKNFDLLKKSIEDYQLMGYKVYILADSRKQQERLKEILEAPPPPGGGTGCAEESILEISPLGGGGTVDGFVFVDKTLHEGFVDNMLKACFFTDHQIFDRFHKYNLRSEKARSGKVALTLKEISQFEIGDYVVHIDHGIGKFGGLVRMPQGDGYQEMIKITYQRGDAIYVSIHSLYKVSKYKAQDNGEPPRMSTLGTGQWERMKERTKSKPVSFLKTHPTS